MIVARAVLFRACEGCGQLTFLEVWQEGPLGCDDCRRAEQQALAAIAAPVSTPANEGTSK